MLNTKNHIFSILGRHPAHKLCTGSGSSGLRCCALPRQVGAPSASLTQKTQLKKTSTGLKFQRGSAGLSRHADEVRDQSGQIGGYTLQIFEKDLLRIISGKYIPKTRFALDRGDFSPDKQRKVSK